MDDKGASKEELDVATKRGFYGAGSEAFRRYLLEQAEAGNSSAQDEIRKLALAAGMSQEEVDSLDCWKDLLDEALYRVTGGEPTVEMKPTGTVGDEYRRKKNEQFAAQYGNLEAIAKRADEGDKECADHLLKEAAKIGIPEHVAEAQMNWSDVAQMIHRKQGLKEVPKEGE